MYTHDVSTYAPIKLRSLFFFRNTIFNENFPTVNYLTKNLVVTINSVNIITSRKKLVLLYIF